eukprot:2129693-Amphidinium_carterae.1
MVPNSLQPYLFRRTPLKNILHGVPSDVDVCPQTVFAVLSECTRDPIASADKTRFTQHSHGSLGQYRVRLHECLKYSISPSLQLASSHYQELLMDSLFHEVSSAESKEISMWIDGKQEGQVFAGSYRLNPMDQHVKYMMRSIDSLKDQGEYNMDTVTGSLFAKLNFKSVLLYTRKKYIPRVAFQTCVAMRGTYGATSPLLEMESDG